MNEIEKFVTILFILYAAYSLYEKCEANPRSGFCGEYTLYNFEILVFTEFCPLRILDSWVLGNVLWQSSYSFLFDQFSFGEKKKFHNQNMVVTGNYSYITEPRFAICTVMIAKAAVARAIFLLAMVMRFFF